MRITATLLLLLATLPSRAAEPQARYAPQFIRPSTAGETRRLALSFKRESQLTITGTPRAREGQVTDSVELTAVTEILAVNEHGLPRKIRLTLDHCQVNAPKIKDTFARGQVLTMEWRRVDGFVVTREGTELSPEAGRLLAEVLPWSRTGPYDRRNAPLFATAAAPLAVGDATSLPGDALALFTPRSVRLDKTHLTGAARIAAAVRYRGEPCLKVAVGMTLPNGSLGDAPTGVLPRDVRIVSGTLDGDVVVFLPLDASRPSPRWTENFRLTATAEPRDRRGQVTAAVNMTRTIDFTDVTKP